MAALLLVRGAGRSAAWAPSLQRLPLLRPLSVQRLPLLRPLSVQRLPLLRPLSVQRLCAPPQPRVRTLATAAVPATPTAAEHSEATLAADAAAAAATAKELKKVRPRRPPAAEEIATAAASRPNRRLPASELDSLELRRCTAIAVAESFDIAKLRRELDPTFYRNKKLMSDQALYCEIEHSTSVFFFHDGSLVCWQATESQIERCLFDARQAQSEPYVASAVETEEMNYVRKAEGHTGMVSETIVLVGDAEDELVRERLAFSNGLARSAKLAVLESQLEMYLERNRHLPLLMMSGKKLPLTREDVLQQIGELLYFRGKLNLHSELLETPDFYWSEAKLEELYHMMSRTLDVNHRISILNKKLDYANELVGVLRGHLSEKHTNKLEWSIIWLIFVEVVFVLLDHPGIVDPNRWLR